MIALKIIISIKDGKNKVRKKEEIVNQILKKITQNL